MNATDDIRLLHQYVSAHSEAAFTTLVQRHLKLVHSAAWRQTCSSELAEEVTQAVFIALARKAPAIRSGANLSSWLYRATRFAALGALKTERRRHQREQEALRMETELTRDSDWEQVFPLLDEAMAKLREKDRAVVLLRYFEELSLAEVGSTLGITEEAAKKRLSRALEKLRAFFSRRGTTLPSAAIGGLLAANAVQAAPAALAATAAATAWLGGACAPAPTVALAKGILKAFIRAKLKSTVTFGTAAALGLGAAVLLIEALNRGPWSQAVSQVSSGPQAYQVTGVVRFKSLTELSYRKSQRWEVPFKAQVQGSRWRIDLPPCESHPDSWNAYFYDGQVTYVMNAFPSLVEKRRRAGEAVAENVANSRIQKLPFPRDMNSPEASLIWLAYCSQQQFANAVPGQFVPVFAYGGGVQIFDETPAEPQRAYWAVSTQSPRVPTKFTALLTLPAPLVGSERAANMQPPSGPLTNVAYAVQYWTNVGVLHLPSVASVTVFKVEPRVEIEMSPTLAMQVVVSSLSVGTAPSLNEPPPMPFVSTIEDERSGARGVGSNWMIRGRSILPRMPQVRTRSKP